MPREKIEGFMSKIAFDHELGNAMHGTKIYPSEQEFRTDHPCHCGCVRVSISLEEVIEEETL